MSLLNYTSLSKMKMLVILTNARAWVVLIQESKLILYKDGTIQRYSSYLCTTSTATTTC